MIKPPVEINQESIFHVHRIMDIMASDLFAEANRLGESFAVEYFGLWKSRRDDLFPFGEPPNTAKLMTFGHAMCAKFGTSMYMFSIAIDYIEKNGFPNLSNMLYEYCGYGTAKYAVAGEFYRGFMNKWRRMQESERRKVIEAGVRHIDALWAE